MQSFVLFPQICACECVHGFALAARLTGTTSRILQMLKMRRARQGSDCKRHLRHRNSDELYPSVQVVRSFPKMCAFSNEVMGQPTEGRSSRPQSLETCPFRMLSFARFPCPSEPDLAAPGRLDGTALGSFLRALGGKRDVRTNGWSFGTWASEYVGEGKL